MGGNKVAICSCAVCGQAHMNWRKLKKPMCNDCIKAESDDPLHKHNVACYRVTHGKMA